MKRTISTTNERVNKALDEAKEQGRASRLIEDAILYYLESIEEERISRTEVKDIVLECLKGMIVAGPISNQNYVGATEDLDDDIEFIRGLGD